MGSPAKIRYLIACLIVLTASCRPATAGGVEPIAATPTAWPTPAQLRQSTTPAATPTDKPSPTALPATATATLFPEEYLHTITDDTGAITAVVPVVWSDLRTIPWVNPAGATIGTTFMASTDIEAFLKWQVEGISISVSHKLDKGYIQLLDEEYANYSRLCHDPFLDRWDFANEFHRGNYYALVDCGGVKDGWLRLFSVVGRADPKAYTARVLAYDMIPIYGDDFGDILMMFQVNAENLP